MSENNKKVELFLAAIDQHIQTNTVSAEEKKVTGKDYITWGDNNKYPSLLLECYKSCSTLQSIINGTGDFVTGDDIICNVPNFQKEVNKNGDTINDLIGKISNDYLIFGSFAIQVIRNFAGQVAELYWIDINKLRSDEKNEVFYYSDDWSKSYGRVKTIVYPKFNAKDSNATSIFYYKNPKSRGVYGVPMWSASVPNVQIDMSITKFHQNEVNNNFMGSKMISFCNGVPSDELKLEIERNLTEKFGGSENAGRFLISFSDNKENAPEVLNLGSDDFDKRYIELEKRNTQQLFIAFRAIPQIFGLAVEGSGFNREEYLQSYSLYSKTMVKPIQNAIVDSFDKIFGQKDSIEIKPFSVDVVEDITNKTDAVK